MKNYFWMEKPTAFREQPSDFFILSEIEKDHIRLKHGFPNQLIYAIMLKYFESEGQFPDRLVEISCFTRELEMLAIQLDVKSSYAKLKQPTERTFNRFCTSIRNFLAYRELTTADKIALSKWLSKNVLVQAPGEDELLVAINFFCRQNRIELMQREETNRFAAKVSYDFEQSLFQDVAKSLTQKTKSILDQIIEESSTECDEEDTSTNPKIRKKLTLIALKRDTAHLKKESILHEIDKHNFLQTLGLPGELSDLYSRKLLLKYTNYVKGRVPSDLRHQIDYVRYSQLAFFCAVKTQQSADTLADLLLRILHNITKKAEKYVDKCALAEVKKVKGKFNKLVGLSKILLESPDGIIKQEVYPKFPAEELEEIVKEGDNLGWYKTQLRIKALSLYKRGRRNLLKKLLQALTFETNDKELQELLLAVELIRQDRLPTNNARLPYLKVILKSWGEDENLITFDNDAYELAILEHFAKELKVKNIWVKGAHKYQNPIQDLPQDFEERKAFYYTALNLPENYEDFINPLLAELSAELTSLNDILPYNDKVILVDRPKPKGAIKLSPSLPQEEPTNLDFLHRQVSQLWPNIPLLDLLKEVDLRVGFTEHFTGLSSHSAIPKDKLQKRLLLCIYGMGTNIGLKRLATAHTGETYADLRYVKNRYLSAEHIRSAIQSIVNSLLKVRKSKIWGDNNIGCACDSKRFNVWVQNLFGGWHGRYKAHGLMVYSHIDAKSMPIYMQVTRPGDSEVGAMLTGCIHHDSDMDMDEVYTDTHGQSTIGFAFSHLLGFDLCPRIKALHKQKLFVPSGSFKHKLPNLDLALAGTPINIRKIKDNYNEVVKVVAAIRNRTVEADVLLKRLSADNEKSPIYQALLEIGKASRTIFLCRYLREEEFRIQINEMLNAVERHNGALSFIFHGKQGTISTNNKEDQEIAVLCLHLIQICLIYMNTLMIQEVLEDNPNYFNSLNESDLRALTALIHEHINTHGILSLDMHKRLSLKIDREMRI